MPQNRKMCRFGKSILRPSSTKYTSVILCPRAGITDCRSGQNLTQAPPRPQPLATRPEDRSWSDRPGAGKLAMSAYRFQGRSTHLTFGLVVNHLGTIVANSYAMWLEPQRCLRQAVALRYRYRPFLASRSVPPLTCQSMRSFSLRSIGSGGLAESRYSTVVNIRSVSPIFSRLWVMCSELAKLKCCVSPVS